MENIKVEPGSASCVKNEPVVKKEPLGPQVVKYFEAGDCVKVINGRYSGETAIVTKVDEEEVSKQLEATKAEMTKVQKKHTEELAKKNQATSKKIEEFTKNTGKKQKISSKKSIKKKMNE